MTYCNEFVHVYQGNHTVCMCGQSSYSLEQAKILDLEKQLAECQKERDDAKNAFSIMVTSGFKVAAQRDKYAAALKDAGEILKQQTAAYQAWNPAYTVINKALREGGGDE